MPMRPKNRVERMIGGRYRHVHSNIHLIRAIVSYYWELSKDFYGRRMDWSTFTCDATYPDSRPGFHLEIDAPRSNSFPV